MVPATAGVCVDAWGTRNARRETFQPEQALRAQHLRHGRVTLMIRGGTVLGGEIE